MLITLKQKMLIVEGKCALDAPSKKKILEQTLHMNGTE